MTKSVTKPRHLEYLTTHPWLTFKANFATAPPSFWLALGECQSKCEHIAGVPLRPDVAEILHHVYLAKGAWGTTAIEGNTLSEEEVLRIAQGKQIEIAADKEYQKQEVDNILAESNAMLDKIAQGKPLVLNRERIQEINRIVLNKLSLEAAILPGEIRRYSVGVMNYRGAPHQDCEYLLDRLCGWLNGEDFRPQAGLSEIHMAILKSMLAHLYIEWIHAFGDGNGGTGRLVEVQILLTAGVPSPACHLLSNHYNQTRNEYLRQLRIASESGGDILPFLTYALNGFIDGLKGQIAYIRQLHVEVAWVNFVHDIFRNQRTKASHRQRALLLDLATKKEAVPIADLHEISPRMAKEYAGMHPRTCWRDVDALMEMDLLLRKGKTVAPNLELISQFLPVKAKPIASSVPRQPSSR